MLKKTVIALYLIVVVVMAAATIIEKYHGTDYAADNIYGAWWFSALWALLTAVAVFYFIQRRVRRPSVVALHLSFVIILAGALLTHLTARQGIIHLRTGETTNRYLTPDIQEHALPFTISLQRFEVQYHEGTQAPSDYRSHIVIDGREQRVVSMNNIVSYSGVRLYQSSYDDDLQGSTLAMNSDPWGIPVSYAGYALLFVSLVWILIDPKGSYRQLLRRAAACLVCCYGMAAYATAASASPRVLPQETADRFGRLFVVYNDRVCPMETYALDFTKKLYGKRSYEGYSATQVLTGFVFFYHDWTREPVIKIKGSEMKQRLNLPDYASFNSLFNQHGYILGPHLQDKDVRKTDEKVSLIMELHQGTPLKIFPYTLPSSTITWYSPTSSLPDSMDTEHRKYIREVFTLLNGEIQAGHYERANQFLDKMLQYQQTFGQRSLPSPTRVEAEHIYNKVPFATILFMVCLTIGILAFALQLFGVNATPHFDRRSKNATPHFDKKSKNATPHFDRKSKNACLTLPFRLEKGLLAVVFLALTCCLALRWIITGHVPMANGYETMLFLAWAVMLLAFAASRKFPVMLTFGFLLSGFFLLVSHISQMDPQITHLMPVLNSPLLTIHVSIIMMAFALLALTCATSLTALCMRRQAEHLQLLSLLLLYPALTCLGFGIFIGAIWANVSWGTYWSWDPKETWALITFMVYAIPAHQKTFRFSLFTYHLYMSLAFLTILMTYFGVNYLLGGMHSYA